MIFDNELHDFNTFVNHWSCDKEYVLFGASNVCEQLIRLSEHLLGEHKLNIKYIVDVDQARHGSYRHSHEISGCSPYMDATENMKLANENNSPFVVKSPQALLEEESDVQIIVTSDAYYQENVAILHEMGFVENVNYCNYRNIAAIWPLFYSKKVHIWRTDILLTSRCTLRCCNCNMYMPHYEHPSNKPLDNIKKDIDLYFEHVDYVSIFHLVGGEPLLHPQIDEIIKYLCEEYRNKIDMVLLTSNGTLLPNDTTLNLLLKYDIILNISDYTDSVDYSGKLTRLIDILTKNKNMFKVRKLTTWLDFGNPTVSKKFNLQELTRHFDSCTAQFRGLHDRKLYYCHLNCSAVMAGIFADNSNDYVCLDSDLRPEELLKFDLGFTGTGYITFCQNCNGCNTGIIVPVPAALQSPV